MAHVGDTGGASQSSPLTDQTQIQDPVGYKNGQSVQHKDVPSQLGSLDPDLTSGTPIGDRDTTTVDGATSTPGLSGPSGEKGLPALEKVRKDMLDEAGEIMEAHEELTVLAHALRALARGNYTDTRTPPPGLKITLQMSPDAPIYTVEPPDEAFKKLPEDQQNQMKKMAHDLLMNHNTKKYGEYDLSASKTRLQELQDKLEKNGEEIGQKSGNNNWRESYKKLEHQPVRITVHGDAQPLSPEQSAPESQPVVVVQAAPEGEMPEEEAVKQPVVEQKSEQVDEQEEQESARSTPFIARQGLEPTYELGTTEPTFGSFGQITSKKDTDISTNENTELTLNAAARAAGVERLNCGNINVTVAFADITRLGEIGIRPDGIVNASNRWLKRGGGVCGAIFAASGHLDKLQSECDKFHNSTLGYACAPGQAVTTNAYDLENSQGTKKIIHATAPNKNEEPYKNSDEHTESDLFNTYLNALIEAQKQGLKHVAIPLLGSQLFGIDGNVSARMAAQATRQFEFNCRQNRQEPPEVIMVFYPGPDNTPSDQVQQWRSCFKQALQQFIIGSSNT